MQKVVRFLEANVEWIALGLGCLFLVYTAYTYLVSQPISGKVGTEVVTPGDVDSYVDEHQVADIKRRISDADLNVPDFTVEKFDEVVTRGLKLDGVTPDQLASSAIDYAPFDPSVINLNPAAQQAIVTQLPNLPKANSLLVAAGLDTLAPGPNGTPAAHDAKLVVCAFSIPWTSLAEEFNKCFGPPPTGGQARLINADVVVMQVVTYRNEKDSSGQWGADVEIPPAPTDLPPYPAAGNKTAENAYQMAVVKEVGVVVAPKIPEVTAGAKWPEPLGALNPTSPTGGGPTGITPNPAPSTDSNASGFLPPANPHYVDMARGGSIYGNNPGATGRQPATPNNQTSPPTPPPVSPTNPIPPSMLAPPRGAVPAAAQPLVPAAPPAPAPGTVAPIVVLANPGGTAGPVPVVPVGKLNPAQMPANSPDIAIYVVDTTAKSGRTYRYHIVYKLLNPLFQKGPQKVPKDKNWTNQFDLVSPVSADSPEITIPVQTYLFCGKGPGKGNIFPFDVITWAAGQWHKNTFNVSQGDPIGGVDNNVDYTTGYSYAGLKPKNGKTSVTLMDDRGEGEVRDAATDNTSPAHKQKSAWVEAAKGADGQPVANTTSSSTGVPTGGTTPAPGE